MAKLYFRGQNLFLYVQFKDEMGNYINVINPTFRIDYEKDGEVLSYVEPQRLVQLSQRSEYMFNVPIAEDAEYSMYDIEYSAEGLDGKIARVNETFHVIPRSEQYSDTIKVYGYINQSKVGYPLISASVKISLPNDSKVVSESYTKLDGKWEAYLYPGEYKFEFNKLGFKPEIIIAQIGVEHSEIQFDNVTLDSEDITNKGNGIYTIEDNFITREGVPLNGLSIKAYNVFNLGSTMIPDAEDITNSDGEYQIFLDPGMYLLKVNGNSLMEDFEQTFRLRVEDDGKFSFENLNENVAVPMNEVIIGRGAEDSPTAKIVSDYVKDLKGNPIVDVQVCVYKKNNLNDMVAQDYTNSAGEWIVYLEPGSYVLEFYHPEFHEFTEEKTIR